MKSYLESERFCETTFFNGGTYYFVSSSGKCTPILFKDNDDFTFAMNVTAQIAYCFKELKVIAFVIMDNHFHFILICDDKNIINDFFSGIKKRLARKFPDIIPVVLDIRPITDLKSMRNHIAYCHRNGYVASSEYTPFNYPWGTVRYYFGDVPLSKSLGAFAVVERRNMFKGRDPKLPQEWKVLDGYVAPSAFCALEFGMAMFRDAHHYFSAISKNVEAFNGIAVELDDGEFLTDTELISVLTRIVQEQYKVAYVRELNKAQLLDLARLLRFNYRSSNGQIRRVTGLSQFEVNSLFPKL